MRDINSALEKSMTAAKEHATLGVQDFKVGQQSRYKIIIESLANYYQHKEHLGSDLRDIKKQCATTEG